MGSRRLRGVPDIFKVGTYRWSGLLAFWRVTCLFGMLSDLKSIRRIEVVPVREHVFNVSVPPEQIGGTDLPLYRTPVLTPSGRSFLSVGVAPAPLPWRRLVFSDGLHNENQTIR